MIPSTSSKSIHPSFWTLVHSALFNPIVAWAAVIIDFALRTSADASASHSPSVLEAIARISVLIILLVNGVKFVADIRRHWGFARTVVASLSCWLFTVLVALALHRSPNLSKIDAVTSLLTFGLFAPGTALSGLDSGLFILLALFLTCILAVVRKGTNSTRAQVSISGLDLQANDSLVTSSTSARMFAYSSLGVLAFGPSVFDLFARQHVERVELANDGATVLQLSGPHLPTILWSIMASTFLGVLILAPMVSLVRGTWRASVSSIFDSSEMRRSILSSSVGPHFLWVTALGFWVRVATLLTVAPTRTDGGDPLFYHVTANLLAQGRGLPEPLNFIAYERWIPSALHGPAYPIVLSISSRLGGTSFFDHKILSILIGTGVVALTMLLAYRIAPRNIRSSSVIVAGLLVSLYPNLWLVDGVLFPEGLMALLTLGVVLLSYRWWSNPTFTTAALLGALTAASALTRGEGLLLSVLLILPLTLSFREMPLKRRLQHLATAAAACVLVIAPWSIRNSRSFEVFVPLSTNGNELFVYANCPPVYEGKFLGFWLFQCQEDQRALYGEPEGDEAEKALHWREVGFDYARDNASDLPKVLAARIGRQWELFRPWQNTDFAPIEGRNKDAARAGLLMYYAMIAPAIAGARLLRRDRTRLLPFAAVFASVTLTAAYAYGTTRFRVPFEPLMCLLAAVGTASFMVWLRKRWSSSERHVDCNVLDQPRDHAPFVTGGSVDIRAVFRPASWRAWASFGMVGIGIAVALPALYRAVGSSMEEGFMLVFPELVQRGFVANVDFLHLYGPGSLHFLAGWFEIFGVSLTSERTFGLLQHLAFVLGLMLLTRPWGRTASTVVGLISLLFVVTPVGLQALAWNGALALGVWCIVLALRASHRRTRGAWIVSGLFGGLTLTFRPDLAVALILAIAYLLWRRERREVQSFFAGAVIGLTSIWFHMIQAGPTAVVQGMLLDPVFRLRGGRELPRPPSLDRLDGALQVISEKFAPWWGFPHLGAPRQLFLWFFLLPIASLAILFVARSIPTHRVHHRVLMVASLFGIGLLPQAMQRPDSAHFLWVSAVIGPLAIIAILEWVRHRYPRTHPRYQLLSGTSAFAVVVFALIPFYTVRTYADLAVRSLTGQLDVREVSRNDRYFYLGDERPWRATLEVVDDLGAMIRPGDRLFVGPVDLRQTAYSDAFFYHLFPEAIPATYYIEMDPGLANQDPRLADDVSSADWLILTRFWSGWIEPNSSVEFGSDLPNQVVEDNFCLKRSYQNDLVRLFVRCDRGDGIGPYEGPYKAEHDYAVEVLVPVPPRPDGTCTPTCRGRPSTSRVEIGIDTSIVE